MFPLKVTCLLSSLHWLFSFFVFFLQQPCSRLILSFHSHGSLFSSQPIFLFSAAAGFSFPSPTHSTPLSNVSKRSNTPTEMENHAPTRVSPPISVHKLYFWRAKGRLLEHCQATTFSSGYQTFWLITLENNVYYVTPWTFCLWPELFCSCIECSFKGQMNCQLVPNVRNDSRQTVNHETVSAA